VGRFTCVAKPADAAYTPGVLRVFLALIFCAYGCSPAMASTITVGDSGDVATLSDVVWDELASEDRLLLTPVSVGFHVMPASLPEDFEVLIEGVHSEFHDTIELRAESAGSAIVQVSGGVWYFRNLILNGEGSQRAVEADNAVLRFSGVTIRNSTGGEGTDGGAILANGSDLSFEDCALEGVDQHHSHGGLVYLTQGSLEADGTVFSGGQADWGGAVRTSKSTVQFVLCEFTDNLAHEAGGAVYTEGKPALAFTSYRTDYSANTTGSGVGRDIYAEDTQLLIAGSSFIGVASGSSTAQAVTISNPTSESFFAYNVLQGDGATVRIADQTGGQLAVLRNLWTAASLPYLEYEDAELLVSNNQFLHNLAPSAPTCMIMLQGSVPGAAQYNHFLGDGESNGCAFGGEELEAGFHANLIGHFADPPVAFETTPLSAYFTYNAFYDLGGANVVPGVDLTVSSNLILNEDELPFLDPNDFLHPSTPEARYITWNSSARNWVVGEENAGSDQPNADVGAFGGPYSDATLHHDLDLDGVPNMGGVWDCDDTEARRSPEQFEGCTGDGLDNDCNGALDDTDGVNVSWYEDLDGDGWGTTELDEKFCIAPANSARWPNDCDDDDFDTDNSDLRAWYVDDDEDGWGDPTLLVGVVCSPDDDDTVEDNTDCDDDVAAVNPGARESDCPNDVDDDCDGVVDDGAMTSGQTGVYDVYSDADGDGFAGTPYDTVCEPFASYYMASDGTLTLYSITNEDCLDSDPDVSPDANDDDCNGVDDNCDGDIDELSTSWNTWYPDGDGDGYGLDSLAIGTCDTPDGHVLIGGDCLDTDDTRHPAAEELCNGVDDNCTGGVDEALLLPYWNWYADFDSDGHGVATGAVYACAVPYVGWVTLNDDCDDDDVTVFPDGPKEVCDGKDNDCVDGIDNGWPYYWWYADHDGDGFGITADGRFECEAPDTHWVTVSGDCNDLLENVHPGVVFDGCNGEDDDCDDEVDEDTPKSLWYHDGDDDGYGFGAGKEVCDKPTVDGPWVQNGDDCDDTDGAVAPDQSETCNGVDDDCDGGIDEGKTFVDYYPDADEDGFGDIDATAEEAVNACAKPLGGYATSRTDCDDDNDLAHPNALETCGGKIDLNCDGLVLACTGTDDDGDGFCEATSCSDLTTPGDCNDADPLQFPHAPEQCNDEDDDCDGFADEGLSPDLDGDGYFGVGACTLAGDDCHDLVGSVHPGALEQCNGLDDDCDGDIDEGLFIDADGDGWPGEGSCGVSVFDCDDDDDSRNPGLAEIVGNDWDEDCDGLDLDHGSLDDDDDGYCEATICLDGSQPGDCDDTVAAVNPDALEVLNGVDDNCDGEIDELSSVDADGDGYSPSDGDCDDTNEEFYPRPTDEICDGLDTNCSGFVGASEADVDGDGLRPCEGDCDDFNAAVRPFLAEDCSDGLDNNCNEVIDEDADSDLDGWTTCAGDCADLLPDVNPDAVEACNGLDDDCDGRVDDGFDRDGDGFQPEPCDCIEAGCDCADEDALIHPDAMELCHDNVDNDCDGTIDKNADQDGDGWGTCENDCDDDNIHVSPGALEVCNGRDDDCNDLIDDPFDLDGDGMATCSGDCLDSNPLVHLNQEELCDQLDNNCSGVIDEGFADDDGDGELACLNDCNDQDPRMSPLEPEVCDDELDNDCDGAADSNDPDCANDTGMSWAVPFDAPTPKCSTGPGSAGGWLVALSFGLARRRRCGAQLR
jgi:hypothetical protein